MPDYLHSNELEARPNIDLPHIFQRNQSCQYLSARDLTCKLYGNIFLFLKVISDNFQNSKPKVVLWDAHLERMHKLITYAYMVIRGEGDLDMGQAYSRCHERDLARTPGLSSL